MDWRHAAFWGSLFIQGASGRSERTTLAMIESLLDEGLGTGYFKKGPKRFLTKLSAMMSCSLLKIESKSGMVQD
jgi:hypothetical protein